jgi:hypothetical protein
MSPVGRPCPPVTRMSLEDVIRRTGFLVASLLCGAAAAIAQPQFVWPVACEIGRNCVIQQYVDHDPGSGTRDYTCGTLVNDGHNGTDIRVPDLATQRAGVDVLAAADGAVLRTRDEMPDVSVATAGHTSVEGRNCGNGLLIDHGGGWETQYCHLARGSVRNSRTCTSRCGRAGRWSIHSPTGRTPRPAAAAPRCGPRRCALLSPTASAAC